MTNLGVIFPPDLPPERLLPVARAADASGLDQLWVWEDCFKEAGIASATAALAATDRLTLGIGLLPAPLRNVALTAMELATVARLFPGRFLPGIGHGVLDWMGQVGARAESPMTLLGEYVAALRELLHGGTVNRSGRYVSLTDVTLDWPPPVAPPLLVGAVKPRTLALAGTLGDGIIFTGGTDPRTLRESLGHFRSARRAAGASELREIVVAFVSIEAGRTPRQIAHRIDEYRDAGATEVALLSVGDGPPLEDFTRAIGEEVRPLVE
jgi:alkanesulfonate monooxygenase SsuD/methylene tetrahydromethanopterin reductase-like flavin-dependent oxidoreductase (luciferase family)